MLEIKAIDGIRNSISDASNKSSGNSSPRADDAKNSRKEIRDRVQLSPTKDRSYEEIYLRQREKISQKVIRFLAHNKTHLRFNVEWGKGLVTVEVIKDETGEVIRRIPPDELARLARTKRDEELMQILSST